MSEIQPVLEKLVSQYPWISALVFWMGAARLVLKWISGPLQNRMTEALVRLANEDEAGDAMAHRIVLHPAYRITGFLLDLTCSCKLPTHATMTEKLAAESKSHG